MKATDPHVSPQSDVSSGEIPGLARVGNLSDVQPKATASTAGTVPAPAGATGPIPAATVGKSLWLADRVDGLLTWSANRLNPGFIARSLAFGRSLGHGCVLAGAALTLVYAIYAAIRNESFSVFLAGLGMVVAIAVAQYAARRFIEAADVAIANTPNPVSPTGFLECAGLLALVFGVVTIVGGIVTAIRVASWLPVWPALLLTVGLVYVGAIALHPHVVNVSTAPATAGDEAVGLLSFFAKAGLKVVPLFFGLLALGGSLAIVASFFDAGQQFVDTVASVLRVAPFVPASAPYGLSASAVVLFACLLPMMAYFGFLLQYLFLDVLRAILAVPVKLDSLRK